MSLLGPLDEPLIHSDLPDGLPDDHPRRTWNTYCDDCSNLLHAVIDGNMQTWVEAQRGNYCLPCFAKLDGMDGSEVWGVPK